MQCEYFAVFSNLCDRVYAEEYYANHHIHHPSEMEKKCLLSTRKIIQGWRLTV
jgi:hypothetical protein